MRFALKLIVGGLPSAVIGVWWSLDAITDGPVNAVLGGLIWKGPLLFVLGSTLAIMGFRTLAGLHGANDQGRSPAQRDRRQTVREERIQSK
jgi:hypothetical protein